MGIFSRDKIPEPYISVALDEACHDPFHPGARITGTITLQNPVQRQLCRSQISFFGHVVTHNTRTESSGTGQNRSSRTIHYHDDAELFCFNEALSHDITIEQDQTYTWRFDFTFPGMTASGRAGVYTRDTASSGIYTEESHPLPPTFREATGPSHYAMVEYNVQTLFSFYDREDPYVAQLEPLIFLPFSPPPPNTLTEVAKPTEKYSSSRLVGQEKSFKHSVRDRFSSQTPHVYFTMKASLASHLVTSSAFPIYACVEIGPFSDPSISIPSIDIKIKSLKLHPITFYRALRVRGSSRPEHEVMDDYSILLNAVPENRLVQQQHITVEDKKTTCYPATFEARIPGDACPTFRTFNINHTYLLKVTVEAEICGKTFEHKFEVPDIMILSSLTG